MMISIMYKFATYPLYLSFFPIATVVGRMCTLLPAYGTLCDVYLKFVVVFTFISILLGKCKQKLQFV